MPKRKKFTSNSKHTGLFLGIIVVVVLVVLGIIFIKGKGNIMQTSSISTQDLSQAEQNTENTQPSFYIVKQGDSLWSISENIYKSGYNWVDIAKANKLENPGLIYVGTRLEIPKLQAKTSEANAEKSFEQPANSSITGNTYAVVKGDNLWEIAVRAYGDGFRWVDIAKANNLVNPNLIHSGNIFKIPR
ncbi:MAG: LysM peptidoglycan-binding domain-containing protein [Candidatus Levybacteria bacterium]|nr:LysM peptidoglycan-binding domain-containing protein [Candidatus Levybacteria bacterium]